MNQQLLIGRIKGMNRSRGFGFIRLSDGSEVFFHANDCGNEFENWRPGTQVEFTVTTQDDGRTCAQHVHIVVSE